MYHCVKGLVPDYIYQLIPPLVGEMSDYNLRNASNFSNFRTRKEVFSKSCLPSAVSLWNEPSPDIKQCESFTTFQHQFKLHLFGTRKVPEYFLKGNLFLSVMYARIRNQCSNLNGDLFKNFLSNFKACSCGYETEDADHYFFNCNKYIDKQIIMFRKARAFHPLSVEALLFGKSSLSDNVNVLLFQAVQQYIKDTLILMYSLVNWGRTCAKWWSFLAGLARTFFFICFVLNLLLCIFFFT